MMISITLLLVLIQVFITQERTRHSVDHLPFYSDFTHRYDEN